MMKPTTIRSVPPLHRFAGLLLIAATILCTHLTTATTPSNVANEAAAVKEAAELVHVHAALNAHMLDAYSTHIVKCTANSQKFANTNCATMQNDICTSSDTTPTDGKPCCKDGSWQDSCKDLYGDCCDICTKASTEPNFGASCVAEGFEQFRFCGTNSAGNSAGAKMPPMKSSECSDHGTSDISAKDIMSCTDTDPKLFIDLARGIHSSGKTIKQMFDDNANDANIQKALEVRLLSGVVLASSSSAVSGPVLILNSVKTSKFTCDNAALGIGNVHNEATLTLNLAASTRLYVWNTVAKGADGITLNGGTMYGMNITNEGKINLKSTSPIYLNDISNSKTAEVTTIAGGNIFMSNIRNEGKVAFTSPSMLVLHKVAHHGGQVQVVGGNVRVFGAEVGGTGGIHFTNANAVVRDVIVTGNGVVESTGSSGVMDADNVTFDGKGTRLNLNGATVSVSNIKIKDGALKILNGVHGTLTNISLEGATADIDLHDVTPSGRRSRHAQPQASTPGGNVIVIENLVITGNGSHQGNTYDMRLSGPGEIKFTNVQIADGAKVLVDSKGQSNPSAHCPKLSGAVNLGAGAIVDYSCGGELNLNVTGTGTIKAEGANGTINADASITTVFTEGSGLVVVKAKTPAPGPAGNTTNSGAQMGTTTTNSWLVLMVLLVSGTVFF